MSSVASQRALAGALPERGAPRSRAAARRAAGVLGMLALAAGALIVAVGSAGNDYIVDTASAPEPSWLHGALRGLGPALTDTGFSVGMLLMLGGYVAAVAWADELAPRPTLAVLAGLIVLFGLAPVLLSSDLFHYIAYARISALHGLNPYVHSPSAVPRDPIVPLVFWKHVSSPYGPLFTVASYAFVPLGVQGAVWGMKAFETLAALLAMGLTWRCAAGLGVPPLRATVLLAGNPLLLAYAVGGAHNDLLVLVATLAAVALLARAPGHAAEARRERLGGIALALALALKASAAIQLPFAFVRRGSRPAAAGLAAVAVVGGSLTLALYGMHVLDTVSAIGTQSGFTIAWSGPDLVGRLLGTGITAGVRLGFGAALAAVGLANLVRVRRGSDWLNGAGWTLLAALCAIASLVPWYVAWVLPAAALDRGRALRVAMIVFTTVVIALHLPLLGFDPAP